MTKQNNRVFGVGINDVDYSVSLYKTINGEQTTLWVCPYYKKWVEMLRRCYSTSFKVKCPTYEDCTCCDEWLYLSNFRRWVDSQPNKDWANNNLDKDLLFPNNKYYSPDTCVFIGGKINLFITDSKKIRGKHMIGVTKPKRNGQIRPFAARCRDPFKSNGTYLGSFKTELEAHKAWQAKKHEYAFMLAELQDDERVANILRTKYAPDKDWTKE